MAFLEIRDITLRFGGLCALDGVSLHVDQGEIVSLVGPNGAGKTTIFNLLTGVYTPDAGEMTFMGQALGGLSPQTIVRLGIARTFQNLRLFPRMRVIENVLVGSHIHTGYNFLQALLHTSAYRRVEAENTVRAIELLKSIGMGEHIHDFAGNLPYGDQRKVEIARAMATDAKLLLLDEPAAGMNPAESEALLEFIRHLKTIGYTVLLIEHDMNVVMNVSDRVYVLDHGKLIAEGLPEEIADNPAVIDAYLGASVDGDLR